MAEAISLAKELKDVHGLAAALWNAGILAHHERNPADAERFVSDLIELSTREDFALYRVLGAVYRGWARSAFDDTTESFSWIEEGIDDYRATGAMLEMPFLLALKAEALYLAHRISEALQAISEAEALVDRFAGRYWFAELQQLRGVFLAATGGDESQIEASFCEAIRIAREQKSVSLEERAEASYAEYRRQKGGAAGGYGFRLPLW